MDRSVLLSATTYTLFGLATIFTAGRVLARWSRLGGSGYSWDDWTSLLTYVCVVGLTVANYYQLANGFGRDADTLEEQSIERFLLWTYVAETLYVAAVFGTKISLVLLYLRALKGKSGLRIACWLLTLALICAFVAFEVVTIVQCLPISSYWQSTSDAPSTCVDRDAYAYSRASVNIAFDLVVLLFPLPRLLQIDPTFPRKLGICAILLVGLAVIAISAVRFKYLNGVTTTSNVTWYYSYIGLYSSIEVYLSQMCCCMPAVSVVFGRAAHESSRLSNSRKSASTAQSQDRASGGVVGIKGIGPSDPDDPEKARSSDDRPSEEYERAPSPTIGLQSHQAWDQTISSISQFPVRPESHASHRFRQPSPMEVRIETPSEASTTDLQVFGEESEEERPLEARSVTFGVPSIVHNSHRKSEPRPQTVRLSTDLVPFTKEPKPTPSRLNLHSW